MGQENMGKCSQLFQSHEVFGLELRNDLYVDVDEKFGHFGGA